MATMWLILVSCIVLMNQHEFAAASKIVFFPLPVLGSQYFNMLIVAEEMASRGHQVSILTTSELPKRKSVVKHVDYYFENQRRSLKVLDEYSSSKVHGFSDTLLLAKTILDVELESCFAMLKSKETMTEIEDADMIVSISVMICGIYIPDIFDKPFILIHPANVHFIGKFFMVPSLPSYVPFTGYAVSEEMTFLQRTTNFLRYSVIPSVADALISYFFRDVQALYGWKSNETFGRLMAKASLLIATQDFAFEFVHPLMPDVHMVGPVTPKLASPLPADLEEFMQSSGEDGVVVISFGSAISHLNQDIVKTMLTALSQLKQKVIFKLKVKEDMTIPSNVKIVKWLPQNDLLGHPKTKAFISHMGINGASEAAFHGVPTVAACLMSDSFSNFVKFDKKAKMVKLIDVVNADVETWRSTIEEVIYNSSYKENAMKISKLMRSWPKSNAEKAGDLIQYAIDNGGRLPHLKSYASNLYWFQYHCLDVILFLVTCFVVVALIFFKLFQLLCSLICSRKKDKKD